MAFGFPARFSERRAFQLRQDELAAAVRAALENLGWSYKALSDEEFLASVPFSGLTWGEEFKVRIHPGGVIEAESECVNGRVPQVFDFGRNRQNVQTFLGLVARGTGQGIQQRPVNAAMQESARRVAQAVPQRRLAVTLFGGCLIAALAFGILIYLVTSVIGLLTGNLYLLGRGDATVVHGTWARIISAVILALFVWILVRVLKFRRKTRA